jgi:hypothetical protein
MAFLDRERFGALLNLFLVELSCRLIQLDPLFLPLVADGSLSK